MIRASPGETRLPTVLLPGVVSYKRRSTREDRPTRKRHLNFLLVTSMLEPSDVSMRTSESPEMK